MGTYCSPLEFTETPTLADGELCAAAAGREDWCMMAKRGPWKKILILWMGWAAGCSTVQYMLVGRKVGVLDTRVIYTARAPGVCFS